LVEESNAGISRARSSTVAQTCGLAPVLWCDCNSNHRNSASIACGSPSRENIQYRSPPPRYEAWNNPATGLAPESPDRIPTPDSTESGGLQALSERTISSHSNPFHRFFTLGSTKEEVLAIQGIPTQLNERIWQYGKSLILFENNRVVGWTESPSNPLAVAEGAKQMN